MSNIKYLKYKKKYLDLKLELDNKYLMKGGFIDDIDLDFDVFFGNCFTDLINDYNNGRMFRIGIQTYFINKRKQLKSTLEKIKQKFPEKFSDKSQLKEKLSNIFFPTKINLINQLIILKKLDDYNPSKSELRLAGNINDHVSAPEVLPPVIKPLSVPHDSGVLPFNPGQRKLRKIPSVPSPEQIAQGLLGEDHDIYPTIDWLQIELSKTDLETYKIEDIPHFPFPTRTDETPVVESHKIPKNSNNFLQFIFDIIYQFIQEI